MLRKRTRSHQKDQHCMGHLAISNTTSKYFSQADGHGFCTGLSPKGLLLGSDSVRSPTSPLEFRAFSDIGNPVRIQRSSSSSLHDGLQKCWDCSKVGLSIIDSLEACSKFCGKVMRSSDSKNIIFRPRMRIRTPYYQTHQESSEISKSLPKDYSVLPHIQSKSFPQKGDSDVLFEIGVTQLEPETFGKSVSRSFGSCMSFSTQLSLTHFNRNSDNGNFGLMDMTETSKVTYPSFCGGSPNQYHPTRKLHPNPLSIRPASGTVSLSASEIELYEDYTCVTSHGPNPKTVHIYGDCILENHSNDLISVHCNEEKEVGVVPQKAKTLETPILYPSNDFLTFCFRCNKKLEEGKDIYIYRGEKAFCSLNCRTLEIIIDEKLEKLSNPSFEASQKSVNGHEIFENGMLVST